MRFTTLSAFGLLVVMLVGCESHPTAQGDAMGLLASTKSTGSVIEVSPTGTPVDFENVRAAVHAAQPGDIVRLTTGTFDFSLAYVILHGGPPIWNMICLRSHITIEGEPGTVIQGPGRDFPNDPIDGWSSPFGGGGWGLLAR